MSVSHGRSKRKKTGGVYKPLRHKRLFELGSEMIEIRPGEKKVKVVKVMGGTLKLRAIRVKEANVFIPSQKKFQKSEIVQVKENPANPHFVRRNTITKGAVIETKLGLARVTNRPGQEGSVNAVLLEKK
ncbi:TPA: 30S ribosomal protein S8e [archaeon]|nr:30S ribosomal protein S8e [Candidatus Naiadarchaeales archaeon SRR2090153.bin1042]